MPETGTRIGRYEIRSKLGEGGMGEVYRARDEKLSRDVAIKVLPAELSTNSDRLHRFEQEAQAAGALNHPNILAVYDVGAHECAPYVVSELLEGETLRELVDERTLGTRKAIDYAIQLTHGLAAAHDKGIVHRDLKPDNIFVTKDDHVKILDFGLAKLIQSTTETDVPQTDIATRKVRTDPGTVMGTVGYMSPEQVRGQTVDHRSDIFSFGSILYEMLCGRRAFRRDTSAETMTAILKEEPPDLSLTKSTISPALEKIIRRCLEKQPARRFQTATDLAFALEALSMPSGATLSARLTSAPSFETEVLRSTALSRAKRERLAWIAAGTLLLVSTALLLFTVVRSRRTNSSSAAVVRYEISAPPKAALNLIRWQAITISPDGSTLVFAAASDGISRLYIRRRDDPAIRPIAGTEGAANPVLSPDGKSIAFFADFSLKKVTIDGPVATLLKVEDARGIAWASEDSLIYAPTSGSGLFQISADGGQPRQITNLVANKNERTHRWVQVLPGGKFAIFTVGTLDSPDSYEKANIDAVNIATGERRTIWQGASMARYAPTGHLIFARGSNLYAVGFNPETLSTTGKPQMVLQGVGGDETTGAMDFAIADDGTLSYVRGASGADMRRIVWVDRSGNTQPIALEPAHYNDLRISPDGSKLAVLVGSSGSGDVWVYDFARATSTRLTFNTLNASPVWSADSKYVYYSEVHSNASENKTLFMRKPADGSREPEAVASLADTAYIKALTPDGAVAILDSQMNSSNSSILQLPLSQGAKPNDLVVTQFNEYASALSPDGRWLAYQSSESGKPEVYVRELSGAGGRWKISTEGGEEPRWSRDGHALYYRIGSQFMNVTVNPTPAFAAGKPVNLFNGIFDLRTSSGVSYDVDPKSDRFLMIRGAEESTAPSVMIVLNWFDELRRVVPAK